jgi:hypothetical protein
VTELIELGRDREAAELAGIAPDELDELDGLDGLDGLDDQPSAQLVHHCACGCPGVHQPTD